MKQMQQIDLNLTYVKRVFSLEITNTSQSPVRIWNTSFSYGYYSIYFQVSPSNGKSCSIRRKLARWTVNIPDFHLIQPGDAYIHKLELTDGTWDLNKCNLDPQTEIDIAAVLEIIPDEYTDTYGVVTGRYESNKLHFKSLSDVINMKKE